MVVVAFFSEWYQSFSNSFDSKIDVIILHLIFWNSIASSSLLIQSSDLHWPLSVYLFFFFFFRKLWLETGLEQHNLIENAINNHSVGQLKFIKSMKDFTNRWVQTLRRNKANNNLITSNIIKLYKIMKNMFLSTYILVSHELLCFLL